MLVLQCTEGVFCSFVLGVVVLSVIEFPLDCACGYSPFD